MYPPRPLFPPSDSDIALAEAGDSKARTRVKVQRTRVRKRQREIQQWYRKNGVVSRAVSPAKSNDDVSLHDDAGDDAGDDDAMDNAFANDIRYV